MFSILRISGAQLQSTYCKTNNCTFYFQLEQSIIIYMILLKLSGIYII